MLYDRLGVRGAAAKVERGAESRPTLAPTTKIKTIIYARLPFCLALVAFFLSFFLSSRRKRSITWKVPHVRTSEFIKIYDSKVERTLLGGNCFFIILVVFFGDERRYSQRAILSRCVWFGYAIVRVEQGFTTLERKESSSMTVRARRSPFESFRRDSTLRSFIIRPVWLLFIPPPSK